jgi:hypothetical protein
LVFHFNYKNSVFGRKPNVYSLKYFYESFDF